MSGAPRFLDHGYGVGMTLIFGEVADLYDDVRPGYPLDLLTAVTDYHGGVPASVADLGAGTGKATELLIGLGAPITAIEPDARMAARLSEKFPQVSVVNSTFEQWSPPPGGVDLITAALSWHWLDPATRNQRSRDALTPAGTLAVFGHKFGFADAAQERRIFDVLSATDPDVRQRPDHWIHGDVLTSGVFADVEERTFHTLVEFTTEKYVQLTQTFSPFRRRPREHQEEVLAGLTRAVDDFGGSIVLDLSTRLALARPTGRTRRR
jgi:SAM-dependent methyltransferase